MRITITKVSTGVYHIVKNGLIVGKLKQVGSQWNARNQKHSFTHEDKDKAVYEFLQAIK
jgi:hypothetical protein